MSESAPPLSLDEIAGRIGGQVHGSFVIGAQVLGQGVNVRWSPQGADASAYLAPDNDNDAAPVAIDLDDLCEIRPTADEMMRAVAGVELKTVAVITPWGPSFRVLPAEGNVEYGSAWMGRIKTKRGRHLRPMVRTLSRMGNLRFSEGGIGEPARGSLTHWRTAPGRAWRKPAEEREVRDTVQSSAGRAASNRHWAWLLNAEPHRYIAGRRTRRAPASDPSSRTHSAARDLLRSLGIDGSVPLAQARANVRLPPVPANDDLPALPCGGPSVRASFTGCQCSRTGQMPSLNDEATLNRIVDMEIAAILKAKLPAEHRTALDVAIVAENFRSVGEAFGKVDKNAERDGKRLVMQATKELQKILEDIEECRPLLQSGAVYQ